MIGLLKAFGKGLLYVVGLPFFLLALLVFAVIGLFLFIYQIIRSVIYFFTGQKFFPELPEDRELRVRKEAANSATEIIDQPVEEHKDIIMPLIEERPLVSEPEESSFETVEEACFKEATTEPEVEEEPEEEDVLSTLSRQEAIKDEVPEEEVVEEDNSFEEMEEETLKTSEEETPAFEDEELEEYIPKGSSITSDIDDEDTNNGVDIDYDL